jgi:ClpX C4-type zinc finger protein
MRCRFCYKEARDVQSLLFQKWRETICNECLAVCRDILEDDERFNEDRSRHGNRSEGARLALPEPSEIDDFLARLQERSWMQLRPLLARPLPPLKSRGPELPPICSFCGDGNPGKLIKGPRLFICDRCVVQGERLIEQGSRLIEFEPAQISASLPKVDGIAVPQLDRIAPVLSDGQRERVLDGVREELRRRHDALSSAMQLAAGTTGVVAAVINDGPAVTIAAETMLWGEAREIFYRVARSPIPVCIVGGTSQERRRLALRVHELSNQPGPFVPIDSASPGSLARMREAAKGTLFLDDVPLLSAAAQELLGISLCDDPALRLSTRIVCAARESRALDSRIEQGEFSEALSYDVRWYTVEIGRQGQA